MQSQVPASRIMEDFGEPPVPLPESSSHAASTARRLVRRNFKETHNLLEKG